MHAVTGGGVLRLCVTDMVVLIDVFETHVGRPRRSDAGSLRSPSASAR